MWNFTVLAVFWVIWLVRNRRIFENYSGYVEENCWESRVFGPPKVSLFASFWDPSFYVILLDWRAAVGLRLASCLFVFARQSLKPFSSRQSWVIF